MTTGEVRKHEETMLVDGRQSEPSSRPGRLTETMKAG